MTGTVAKPGKGSTNHRAAGLNLRLFRVGCTVQEREDGALPQRSLRDPISVPIIMCRDRSYAQARANQFVTGCRGKRV